MEDSICISFTMKLTFSIFATKPHDKDLITKFLNCKKYKNILAERIFDLRTSGLWAQHASTAPLCFSSINMQNLAVSSSTSFSSFLVS